MADMFVTLAVLNDDKSKASNPQEENIAFILTAEDVSKFPQFTVARFQQPEKKKRTKQQSRN